MSAMGMLWMALCAVAMLALGQSASAASAWRAAEQPELKQQLERAPVLKTEPLGEPSRGVNTFVRYLVPNPDGKSWDFIQVYFKDYYGPTWLYAIDLGTGQVKKQREVLVDRCIYLSGTALGFDGKFYISVGPPRTAKQPQMDLFAYDPATNTLEDLKVTVPGLGGECRPLVTGTDGLIYGAGTYRNENGAKVGLYSYDPKAGKVVKDYGPVGPNHPNGAWSDYGMGVDDEYAYVSSGMVPGWYLVAVNLKTGEDKVLLESPERISVVGESGGARAFVSQSGGAPSKEYWLYHGEAIPKVDDTPPWPKQASPWDKAAPKPEIYYGQMDPDEKGNATLWYRSREDADRWPKEPSATGKPEDFGWKAITLDGVETYVHRMSRLVQLPDGRLFSSGEDYQGSFLFDPKTDKATLLGRNQGQDPYTHIAYGDKLYSSGYPSGRIYVYDPALPWTVHKDGPPGHAAPERTDAASNPREMGYLVDTRCAIAHSSALGADSKLYFGGFGERSYTGGGFGWYDPKTQKLGGFWKPLSGHGAQWIAPMQGGRLIAISTVTAPDEQDENHRVPEEAKLFFYDVTQGKIVRELAPVKGARTTGLIAEVSPGRLLGLTTEGADYGKPSASILYGVDTNRGEVLFRKTLPSTVSIDNYWPHWVDPPDEYLDLVHGPDGCVWTYLKDVLVRIDPKDASVHVVGRLDPVGMPIFVGNDLYFSGAEQLRRIKNIVPKP